MPDENSGFLKSYFFVLQLIIEEAHFIIAFFLSAHDAPGAKNTLISFTKNLADEWFLSKLG
jgi:hypothetical protein